jgi:hypothetical protein
VQQHAQRLQDEGLTAEASRPSRILARPIVIDRAFNDPDAVLDLLHRRAPYKQILGLYGSGSNVYGDAKVEPWFRTFWAADGKTLVDGAEPFFKNANFIAAARESFKVDIVRPLVMMTNIMAPMAAGIPHMDLPYFRGATSPALSMLRSCMGISRLFRRWEVLVASAVSWFYTGRGGGFEYWLDGLEKPVTTIDAPLWNAAVIGDNEYMYHRVGAIGAPADYLPEGVLEKSSMLHRANNGWEVRSGDGAKRIPYPDSHIRVSFLWKAFVFESVEAERAFDAHSDDLTLDMIVDIFRHDLAKRGVSTSIPDDPINDAAWTATLGRHYRTPYLARAAT